MKQINLLPWREYQANKKRIDIIILSCGILFLIILVIGSFHRVMSYQIKKMDVYNKHLVERLNSTSLSIKKLQQVKQQVDQLQTTRQLLDTSRTQLRSVLTILESIKLLAPSDFFIKTMAYESSYLSIVGSIESENIFLALMRKIEKLDRQHLKWSYKKKQNPCFEFTLNIDLAENIT